MKMFIDILSYGLAFILVIIAAVIGAEVVGTLMNQILER